MLIAEDVADDLIYQPRRHAYQRTDSYLFSQLIPYIGSKRRLLGLINRAVEQTRVQGGLFVDLFAGSGVVSRYAKTRGFRVIANDWEPYSSVLNAATISLNQAPCGPEVFDHLNALPPLEGYITQNYCPYDDALADPERERMYFTRANGMRIDAIRIELARLAEDHAINRDQLNYLLAPLVSAASYTSNTSGLFKAYHRGWGGRTNTAHYRILSDLILRPVQLIDNGLHNPTFALDAQELARNWREIVGELPSLVYLDPPYNQHPYGSNYHLLNSIALWDCPEVPEITKAKSAIRLDWRSERRSSFNTASLALPALEQIIDFLDTRWVLLSYSTDGNIATELLIQSLAQRGALSVAANSYKRYRVSTQRMSQRSHNVEFVLTLDKEGTPLSGMETVLREIYSLDNH